jgi:hypothetical protein
MCHLFPVLLTLGILALPASAETPSAILSKATEAATAIEDLGDRVRGLEPVIEAYAALGETDLARTLLRSETEPSIQGSLWAAFIAGLISGPGPTITLTFIDQIPDPTHRDLALGDIVQAFLEADDMASALSTFNLIPTGPQADFVAVYLARGWLDAGNKTEALAVAKAMTDVLLRDRARLDYVGFLVADGRIDEALAQMPFFGADWPCEDAQLILVGGLARAGRLPEAEEIITEATDADIQVSGQSELVVVAAEQGDPDLARSRLATITYEPEWQAALNRSVGVFARSQGAKAALRFLASVPELPDAQFTTPDKTLSLVVSGLAYEGQASPARALLPAIAGTPDRSRAFYSLVVFLAKDDLATTRADLDAIVDPFNRFNAILAILRATPEAGHEDSLISEALAYARAKPDPVERARALARLATAIGP